MSQAASAIRHTPISCCICHMTHPKWPHHRLHLPHDTPMLHTLQAASATWLIHVTHIAGCICYMIHIVGCIHHTTHPHDIRRRLHLLYDTLTWHIFHTVSATWPTPSDPITDYICHMTHPCYRYCRLHLPHDLPNVIHTEGCIWHMTQPMLHTSQVYWCKSKVYRWRRFQVREKKNHKSYLHISTNIPFEWVCKFYMS